MKIGIVGYGYVGRHLEQIFSRNDSPTVVFDKYIGMKNTPPLKREINSCDLVFVAVPTPSLQNGGCDISAVEEVVQWVTPPMCIKSTIPPGTVRRLVEESGKQIAFSPEYVGETPFHASTQSMVPELVAVGGERALCELIVNAYRSVFGPEPRYFVTDSNTAELAKYMENCFFATKVAFVAQFFLLASLFGADFTFMREIWVADTRVGRSHSTVVGDLGFGGKCLPKDLSAIVRESLKAGGRAELLEAVQEFNERLRQARS
jgi:UDPglucose 6-dehydrogenase